MLIILLLGLSAAAAQVGGGLLVLMRSEWPRMVQEYLLALSAGFLLALVFFELVPESLQLLGSVASLYIICGFGLLHFFEHTVVGHFHFGEETHSEVMLSQSASFSAFAGLFVHSFFDGVSISAGMQYNLSIGLLIFIAIFLHKLPEGLTTASIMMVAGQPRNRTFAASIAIGVATILGVVLMLFLSNINVATIGIALAFSAGAATYVGASDLIPEINRSGNRITPLIVFGGMVLFYFSKLLIEKLVL